MICKTCGCPQSSHTDSPAMGTGCMRTSALTGHLCYEFVPDAEACVCCGRPVEGVKVYDFTNKGIGEAPELKCRECGSPGHRAQLSAAHGL